MNLTFSFAKCPFISSVLLKKNWTQPITEHITLDTSYLQNTNKQRVSKKICWIYDKYFLSKK